jgi:hypothetical protein
MPDGRMSPAVLPRTTKPPAPECRMFSRYKGGVPSAARNRGVLSSTTKWCHYVLEELSSMAPRERVGKRATRNAGEIRSKADLTRAKRAACLELRRIFDEELRQRASERQLARSASASTARSRS